MADQATINAIKLQYPDLNLSDEDVRIYLRQKAGWYKGTIAVCVIYGVFAFVLLGITFLTQLGKELMPFILTIVGGIVFIIIILVLQIMYFMPTNLTIPPYDGDICPDFWTLQQTPASQLANVNASDKLSMTYQCVPNSNVYGTTSAASVPLTASSLGANTTGDFYLATNIAATMGGKNAVPTNAPGGGSDGNLQCNVVYPNYLAAQDMENFPLTQNAIRCAYAKRCNIPWTGVCPELPSQ